MGNHANEEPSSGFGIARAHASLAANASSPPAALLESPRTYLRRVRSSDRRELLALTRASRELHYPWISPPLTSHMFKVYYRRTQRDDHEGFVICLNDTDEIVGVINVNNVVKGAFRSASVGYYASQAHAGRGYMREGLMHVKRHAFRELGLHRIEANIQPDN
ncbi:MAG: GNAT family N-acetyltransferase, partial [Gammaproteobacteria bacterium]|nr:GNAT family N-acetyltransferase [Gammaproteobacteria bacterium]